jgi:hypothetical protein
MTDRSVSGKARLTFWRQAVPLPRSRRHAVRLAHMYFERARMLSAEGDRVSAARDKARAKDLCEWAAQAARLTNGAGDDLLEARIERLKICLDSLPKSGKQRRNGAGRAGPGHGMPPKTA